mmetsp:Transcript_17000/g.34387  ORF Transcript_17000/g.34387 Transcript_17000/m.34387 type:complete len:236 (+) Transcript_17000:780-1487(+)
MRAFASALSAFCIRRSTCARSLTAASVASRVSAKLCRRARPASRRARASAATSSSLIARSESVGRNLRSSCNRCSAALRSFGSVVSKVMEPWWSANLALSSGVAPHLFLLSSSAPALRSIWMALVLFLRAAQCRGVDLSTFVALIDALAAMSSWTISLWLLRAAWCKGVEPSASCAESMPDTSAAKARSTSTTSQKPRLDAQSNGVMPSSSCAWIKSSTICGSKASNSSWSAPTR